MATTYSVEQRESYPQWITCDQCEKEVRDSVIIDLHTDGNPPPVVFCLDCLDIFKYALKQAKKKARLAIEQRLLQAKD
jgi:hypothetical protein